VDAFVFQLVYCSTTEKLGMKSYVRHEGNEVHGKDNISCSLWQHGFFWFLKQIIVSVKRELA